MCIQVLTATAIRQFNLADIMLRQQLFIIIVIIIINTPRLILL